MLIFDLTPDDCASDRHYNVPENKYPHLNQIRRGSSRGREYPTTLFSCARIQIDRPKKFTTNFWGMKSLDIYPTFSVDATSAELFPSDLLRTHTLPRLVRYTLFVNTDAQTGNGSHWVAFHLDTRYRATTVSTRTIFCRLFLPYDTSSDATVVWGTTTLHAARFKYLRVRIIHVSLRSVYRPGTGPSSMFRTVWDHGTYLQFEMKFVSN